MARLLFLVSAVAAAAASAGCGASTDSRERPQVETVTEASGSISIPQNPVDLGIRRDLNRAIADDADLRNREISFIVTNGDVSVSGSVRTEGERRKMNDLALSIGGVKSVANALWIAE
jgi:osmotically-inducible protein OsmY